NTYTGATYVSQGILNVRNGNALGSVANEVQQVTVVGPPNGFFALTFNNATTGLLANTIPASGGVLPTDSVQNALQALATIGAGNVTVTGNPGGPFTVTFSGA